MISSKGAWVLALAGGEGKRLHVLTTQPCGAAVPKQFCSFGGERSLIEEAIDRGAAVVHTERICAIVAVRHAAHRGEVYRRVTTRLLCHAAPRM